MKQPVERRLAAILAADVAGYSRLMGADEAGTARALREHRAAADPLIAMHGGRIVKTTGDGMLVEFPSVVDAVRCAVEIQRAMTDRNVDIPEDKRITFRIGINLGDVIIDGDDIYGDGVNIAARLEALAEPGGICISRVVRDQIRDKLPYKFDDLGEQSVKNIARPVRAYAMSAADAALTSLAIAAEHPASPRRNLRLPVIAAGAVVAVVLGTAVWWAWPQATTPAIAVPAVIPQAAPAIAGAPAPRLSIVVLPFANLSDDREQEYFADGVTDDLTTDLSRISGSFVIARNTSFTYKGKPIDAKQIGRELGVRYVLEGSVRRASDQVRVNVQLIDAESGAHLWADRFDTDRADLAAAQDAITGRLARTLNAELVRDAGRRVEQDRSVDPNARDLVMRGWAWIYGHSGDDRQQALRDFEQALEIDPASGDARIGIAWVLLSNIALQINPVRQDEARAEQLLREALERDPNSAKAHSAMGALRRLQNRFAEARIEFETAIALDRNEASAYADLGTTLMFLGQPEACIPNNEKAIWLNPRDTLVGNRIQVLGLCHLLLDHVDQAIDLLRKALAANPRHWYTHFFLARALGLRGNLDEARAELADAIKIKPEIQSLAQFRAVFPWHSNPPYWALLEKTAIIGLRRAGFPDE